MSESLLADVIVLVHLLFVAFVIVGELLVVAGGLCRWRWVRNPYFRLVHFASIAYVAFNAIRGVPCPLTIWEAELRAEAGQWVETDVPFLGRMVRVVLFYEAPPAVFTTAYVIFAVLVLLTLVFVPPRWPGRRGQRRQVLH